MIKTEIDFGITFQCYEIVSSSSGNFKLMKVVILFDCCFAHVNLYSDARLFSSKFIPGISFTS